MPRRLCRWVFPIGGKMAVDITNKCKASQFVYKRFEGRLRGWRDEDSVETVSNSVRDSSSRVGASKHTSIYLCPFAASKARQPAALEKIMRPWGLDNRCAYLDALRTELLQSLQERQTNVMRIQGYKVHYAQDSHFEANRNTCKSRTFKGFQSMTLEVYRIVGANSRSSLFTSEDD